MLIFFTLVALAVGAYLWERSRRVTHAVAPGLQQQIDLPFEAPFELYHNAFSLCSNKIRVGLSELGVPYRSHPIDLVETGAYENIRPAFLKINPAGLVPVLVHNGHPIYESHEQLRYAAAQQGSATALVPTDPQQRSLMEAWIERTALVGDDPIAAAHQSAGNAVAGLTPPIFAAMLEEIPVHRILEGLLFHRLKQRPLFFLVLKLRGLKSMAGIKPLRHAIDRCRDAMHEHFDALEQALITSGGPYITGSTFTLADVGMLVIFERLREGCWLDAFLTDQRPACRSYWERIKARDSYREAVVGHRDPRVTRATERIRAQKAADDEFLALLHGRVAAPTQPSTGGIS